MVKIESIKTKSKKSHSHLEKYCTFLSALVFNSKVWDNVADEILSNQEKVLEYISK